MTSARLFAFPAASPCLSVRLFDGAYYYLFSRPLFLLAPALFILSHPLSRPPPSWCRQYCSVRGVPAPSVPAPCASPIPLCVRIARDVSPFFRGVPGAISVPRRTICLPPVKNPPSLAVPLIFQPRSQSAFVATRRCALPSFGGLFSPACPSLRLPASFKSRWLACVHRVV